MNLKKAKRIRREIWNPPSGHDLRQHLLRTRRYVALRVKERDVDMGLGQDGKRIYQRVKFFMIGNDPKSARATYLRAKKAAA